MNGTVTPSVVVAVSIWSARRRVLRVVGLERAAVAVRVRAGQRGAVPRRALRQVEEPVGRPAGRTWRPCAPAWQVHGWICGPAKTGPPIGWFVTYRRAALPPRMRAVSATRPTRRPRTRPSRRRRPVRRSARVTLRCPARQAQARGADAARQRHADERVAAGHQVGAVRQHLDPRRGHARRRPRPGRSARRRMRRGQVPRIVGLPRDAFYQTGASAGRRFRSLPPPTPGSVVAVRAGAGRRS